MIQTNFKQQVNVRKEMDKVWLIRHKRQTMFALPFNGYWAWSHDLDEVSKFNSEEEAKEFAKIVDSNYVIVWVPKEFFA